jgi:hypothetical protein
MKKNVLTFIVVIAVMALAVPAYAEAETPTVTFSDTYKDVDTSGVSSSFEQTRDAMDKNGAIALANKIISYTGANLVEDSNESDENRTVYRDANDPSAVLSIQLSTGKVVFNKGMKGYEKEEKTLNLPTSEVAPGICETHLENLAMLPAAAQMVVLTYVRVVMSAYHSGGPIPTPVYDKLAAVRYARQLDGLEVVGASRIVMRLGANGELVFLAKDWTDVEERGVARGDLLDAAGVRTQIENQLSATYPDAQTITVNKAKLAMFDDGKGIIEPAVVVFGVVDDGTTDPYDIDWIMPLLKTPKAQYPYM